MDPFKTNETFTLPNGVRIHVKWQDITQITGVDAVVNAANENLAHGAGVAGAMRRAWPLRKDPVDFEDEKDFMGNPMIVGGEIVIGGAVTEPLQNTHVKAVIHAVGPVGHGGFTPDKKIRFANAYLNSMFQAGKFGYKSIAFPPISTGIFACPLDQCRQIVIPLVLENAQKFGLTDVYFVFFDPGFKVKETVGNMSAYIEDLKKILV